MKPFGKTFKMLSNILFLLLVSFPAYAADKPYDGITINVIAQTQDATLSVMETYLPDFKKKTGISVKMNYFTEVDRRAKSRLDAATKTGAYQVYYIDEANIAEFVSAGWVVPLLDYYPKEYNYDDFLNARQAVASVDGIPYFAPVTGGTDVLYYRKDLLKAAGIAVPTTIDEMVAAAKALNSPPNHYGICLRGAVGSGMNVWRWAPYFKAYGGEWVKNGKIAFNSDAAIKATETYMELMNYAPPGVASFDWQTCLDAFQAGKIAIMHESNPWMTAMFDPDQTAVVGKIDFAAPPHPFTGASYGHGLALSKHGCDDDICRKAAGLFIAWATSQEMEQNFLKAGKGDIQRKSTEMSELYKQKIPEEVIMGNAASDKVAGITFWRDKDWPECGNNLGVILQELFSGARVDIHQAMEEAAIYCNDLKDR